MRQIGHVKDVAQAKVFGDFLVTQGIRFDHEAESDGSWIIWIRDEDQVAAARVWLEKFQKDPGAAEFQGASADAAKVRAAEAKAEQEYQRRVRTGRSLFPKMRGHGFGILSYILIIACVMVAYNSRLGKERDTLSGLYISDPDNFSETLLPEVASGQVWRLFTPALMHFSMLHIVFNMMWLAQLGSMIEGRRGILRFALLVVASAVISNFAQYYFHGPRFGGMSGVVYALAGYSWILGKHYPAAGVSLSPMNMTLMLAWLLICYTGQVGPVANTAHLGGLMVGLVWGGIEAYRSSRRPQ
jgi:GlpG protein